MVPVLVAPGLFALRGWLRRSLPLSARREATCLYDLLLTTGVSPGDAQAKVVELYSPRVTVELGRLLRASLVGGSPFDSRADASRSLWDVRRLEHRRPARAQIARVRPYLVVGSPPCTEFSRLQNRCSGRRSVAERRRRLVEARVLIAFCC